MWRGLLILQVVYLIYLIPNLLLAEGSSGSYTMDDRYILSIDPSKTGNVITPDHPLVVATRLHLGKATSPPADLEEKMNQFADFCYKVCAQAIEQLQPAQEGDATDSPAHDFLKE